MHTYTGHLGLQQFMVRSPPGEGCTDMYAFLLLLLCTEDDTAAAQAYIPPKYLGTVSIWSILVL